MGQVTTTELPKTTAMHTRTAIESLLLTPEGPNEPSDLPMGEWQRKSASRGLRT